MAKEKIDIKDKESLADIDSYKLLKSISSFLSTTRGRAMVEVMSSGKWMRFTTITNSISKTVHLKHGPSDVNQVLKKALNLKLIKKKEHYGERKTEYQLLTKKIDLLDNFINHYNGCKL